VVLPPRASAARFGAAPSHRFSTRSQRRIADDIINKPTRLPKRSGSRVGFLPISRKGQSSVRLLQCAGTTASVPYLITNDKMISTAKKKPANSAIRFKSL
jgi:hypothetical protein